MTAILVIMAGLTLFVVGILVGYIVGQEDGAQEAYKAVERWHEGRPR